VAALLVVWRLLIAGRLKDLKDHSVVVVFDAIAPLMDRWGEAVAQARQLLSGQRDVPKTHVDGDSTGSWCAAMRPLTCAPGVRADPVSDIVADGVGDVLVDQRHLGCRPSHDVDDGTLWHPKQRGGWWPR